MIDDNKIEKLLDSLSNTKFRGSFHLNKKMKDYVLEKGMDKIRNDAYELISNRLASADISNDGKQTPMKQVHPVFIGQHATGTCCRGCLLRIHHISKNRELTSEEIDYIVYLIMKWIKREVQDNS